MRSIAIAGSRPRRRRPLRLALLAAVITGMASLASAAPAIASCPTNNGDAYSTAVLADSPAVYYRLDEPVGTTVCDYSGHGIDGTYNSTGITYGVPGALKGSSDTAIHADGSNGVIGQSTANSPITDRNPFTLEGWFRSGTPQNDVLIGQGNGATTGNSTAAGLDAWHFLGTANSASELALDEVNASNTWDTTSVGINLFDGRWHYLVITYDGTNQVTGYVDDANLGTQTLPEPSGHGTFGVGTSPIHVGNWVGPGPWKYFLGDVDELAEYTKVLPASRIAAHYAAATTGPSGRPLAWGRNGEGQLGDGTTTSSDVPVKVKLPAGVKVTAVAAGAHHTLALTSTGSVLAWGSNANGQLGDGTTTSSDVPVKVKLPKGVKVTALAAGNLHSLAVTSTGSVLAWGADNWGQLGLGLGSTGFIDVPAKVKLPKGTKASEVAAGKDFSLALTSTGSVLAWGDCGLGQCGDGSFYTKDAPVQVKLGSVATAIAAGGDHSLAVTSTGSARAWGYNAYGQLGDGSFSVPKDLPVEVKLPTGTTVVAVAGGYLHSLAVTSTGSVLAWGDNQGGQLGDPNPMVKESDVPLKVKLPKGTKASEVAGGYAFSLALTSKGSVLAWGLNSNGELGDGSLTSSVVPVRVKLPEGDVATEVRAGWYHGLALKHHT